MENLMENLSVRFTGFNGFGQFKNLKKTVRAFHDGSLDCISSSNSSAKQPKVISTWNCVIVAIENILSFHGFVESEISNWRRLPFECGIADIACTENYCMVLLSSGTLYKVSLKSLETIEITSLIVKSDDPIPRKRSIFTANNSISTSLRNEERITHVAAGRTICALVTSSGNVYNIPSKIFTFPSHVKVKKICCGIEHCLILTTNGDVYSFGASSRGQLGLGTLETEDEPVLIEALAGIKVIDIAAGGWHSVAISVFNDLYAWGWNVNGQLGLPIYQQIKESKVRRKNATVYPSPELVNLFKQRENDSDEDMHEVCQVAAGLRHTLVKTNDGTLLSAGWNKYGQLGFDRDSPDVDNFVEIESIRLTESDHIICGDWSTLYFK